MSRRLKKASLMASWTPVPPHLSKTFSFILSRALRCPSVSFSRDLELGVAWGVPDEPCLCGASEGQLGLGACGHDPVPRLSHALDVLLSSLPVGLVGGDYEGLAHPA
jgi:hypothetical protein